MDFFNLLDKVIRGIVYFIYNVVETTATILRHPMRGPLRLSRAHNDADVRQIGGLTYLFLILIFMFQALGAGLGDALIETSAKVPSFRLDTIWPAIVGAFVTTITIDAVLRLVLHFSLPGRHRLRQLLLSMCEFTLLWMVLATIGLSIVVTEINNYDIFDSHVTQGLVVIALSAAALVGSAYPAGQALSYRLPEADLFWAWIGTVFLFAVAIFAGAAVGDQVQRTQRRSELTIETQRCAMLPDRRVAVDGILQLGTGNVAAIEPDDLLLQLGSQAFEVEWRQQPEPERLLIIEPGKTLLIETVTRGPVGAQGVEWCQLDWDVDVKNRELEIEEGGNKLYHSPARTRVHLRESWAS